MVLGSASDAVAMTTDALLDDNVITTAWSLCYVANYFTFPMYQMLERTHGLGRH